MQDSFNASLSKCLKLVMHNFDYSTIIFNSTLSNENGVDGENIFVIILVAIVNKAATKSFQFNFELNNF